MWTNFGDINFAEYGGCLCKPHLGGADISNSPYVDVLYYDPEITHDGKALCVSIVVNTEELAPEEVYDILYASGLETEMVSVDEAGKQEMFEKFGRGWLAKEAVTTSGIQYPMTNLNGVNFFDDEDMYMTDEQIVQYCTNIGAGGYVEGLV